MTARTSPFVKVVVGLMAVVLLALIAIIVLSKADRARADLPVLGAVPAFEFTERSGQPFGLQNMSGKISVVYFGFTRCKGPCPIMSANMAELYRMYEKSDLVRFVTVSVDPLHDSLDVLAEYARDLGVTDDRWSFLTAPIEEVARLSEEGFMLAADDLPGGHSTKFVLVDQYGHIRGYYGGTDPASIEILKTHLNQLLGQAL